jgi:hypothetical protein
VALAIDEVTITEDAADENVTSATFNVDEGDILLVLCSSNGSGAGQDVTITTNTASLALLRTGLCNVREGKVKFAVYRCTAAASGVTVTCNGGAITPGISFVCVEVSGAWKTQHGAFAINANASGTPTVDIKSKREDSYLFSAMSDWSAATNPGPGSSPAETELNDHVVGGEYTGAQNRTTNTLAKGAYQLDVTGSATRNYNIIAVEIVEPPLVSQRPDLSLFPKPKMRAA